VGDAAAMISPTLVASPYNVEVKGFSTHIWCQPVLDALNAQPDIRATHLPNWVALEEFPETPEALTRYDVVILSDVEAEVLLLYPFSRFMDTPMGPNRLKSIRDYVAGGGGLAMIGGWSSFTGRRAIGGYQGTPVEEALPVDCLQVQDDRREAPEGVTIEVTDSTHPLMQGIDWSLPPLFTGYNRIRLKQGAELLARVKETGDPFIAAWSYGRGRALAFASDISPHWGSAFQKWPYYGAFWVQAVRWLAGG